MTRNACSSSQDVKEPNEPNDPLLAVNVLFVILSVLSILCTSFALRILVLCKRTRLQIRYLSANFLMSFVSFETSFALHTLAIMSLQIAGMHGDIHFMILFDSRVLCSSLFIVTTWGSLCAVSVDRVLSLVMPFKHRRYATKLVLRMAIFFLWLFNVLVIATTFIVTILTMCDRGYLILFCTYRPLRLGVASLLSFYAVLIVISCVIILRVTFQHKRHIDKFTKNQTYLADLTKIQKLSKSTKTVFMVILAFICLQSPSFFHTTVFEYS